MKRLFYFAAIAMVLALSSGCKKKGDQAAYYFKYKQNGNWVVLSQSLSELGPDQINPSNIDLVINANSSDMKQIFTLSIQKSSMIGTGSYATDNFASHWADVSLMVDGNTGNMRSYDVEDAPNMPPSKYTINITSITETEIRGNFTGNYLYDDWETIPSDVLRPITEGEFVARRIQ